MASRFLRSDWHRACRLARPQRRIGGAAVSREAIGDPLPSAPGTSFSGGPRGLTFASTDQCSGSGEQLLGRAWSTFPRNCGGGANALGRFSRISSSSSSGGGASGRLGSMKLVTGGLRYDNCWRGGWKGGLCLSHQGQNVEGRRFLSSRGGKAGRQTATKTNRNITAERVLLVLETKDGSKEHTLVSRQQALDAAEAANLDLVQVNGKSDPVVCRLMDFKREEYRKQKLKKAGTKRVQKKKEIRLKGMIANHDFERKVNDVKKYLEKGDIVKVVLEASTSLLKRSGNCLNELQDNFEAEMEDFEGVTMKHNGGGNRYTRREIECIPKAVKAAKPSGGAAPAPAEGTRPSSSSSTGGAVDTTGGKDKPRRTLPRPTRVVDEELVRGILNGTVAPKRHEEVASSTARGSEERSGEHSSGDGQDLASSGREDAERKEEGEAKPMKLELGGVVISSEDVENYEDLSEEAEKAAQVEMDWEREEARRREDRRRRQKQDDKERGGDGYASRRGGGRKKWRAARKDDGDGGDDREAWSEDLSGDEDFGTRRRGRGFPGAGRGGRGDGPAVRRGGATSGRGRGRGSGDGGGRSGNAAVAGKGGGGRGWAPSPAPPVRTTPYKWRTSIADGNDATAGASATAPTSVPAKHRKLRGVTGSQNASEPAAGSRATPRGGAGRVGGAAAAGDVGGEMRGFRARFGRVAAVGGSPQVAPPPPASAGARADGPADSAVPAEA